MGTVWNEGTARVWAVSAVTVKQPWRPARLKTGLGLAAGRPEHRGPTAVGRARVLALLMRPGLEAYVDGILEALEGPADAWQVLVPLRIAFVVQPAEDELYARVDPRAPRGRHCDVCRVSGGLNASRGRTALAGAGGWPWY